MLLRSPAMDYRLKKTVEALILGKHYDSAIRQAFVFFKTTICRKFDLDQELDGERLTNLLFGGRSTYFPNLSTGLRQSYRDLFAGIFGVLRNSYMHNFQEASSIELACVLSNVNLGLHLIGDLQLRDCDVVLVEDDDHIAENFFETLVALNLSVQRFSAYDQAIRYVEEQGAPLIVVSERVIFRRPSDVPLRAPVPESAVKFVDTVLLVDADTPIILTSDYRAEDEPAKYEHIACYKPFRLGELRDIVAHTYQARVRSLLL